MCHIMYAEETPDGRVGETSSKRVVGGDDSIMGFTST